MDAMEGMTEDVPNKPKVQKIKDTSEPMERVK